MAMIRGVRVPARLLSSAVWITVTFTTAGALGPADVTGHHAGSDPTMSPATALTHLRDGNHRFVSGKPTHQHTAVSWRATLTQGQHPFAAILGCSDSRVPPELVFDQGFGDLFVVRVAGNVAETDERGSLEYAVDHLGVPLVVVIGHEKCGAVTSALASEQDRGKETRDIQGLLAPIQPALQNLPAGLSQSERVHQGVEANVRLSVRRIGEMPDFRDRIARGKLRVVGGVYGLDSGAVRWLDN